MVSCNPMQQLRDIANSRNLLWNLTLRELRSKYRRSILGWSWSMLNPLAQMAIYTFVFGVLFGAQAPVGDPSGITTFGLYLLTGLIPWGFFSLICGVGLQAILSNTTLVRKVAFARESLHFNYGLRQGNETGLAGVAEWAITGQNQVMENWHQAMTKLNSVDGLREWLILNTNFHEGVG